MTQSKSWEGKPVWLEDRLSGELRLATGISCFDDGG